MKRNLLSSVAALVASAMTSLVVVPYRVGPKSPFGPCATMEFEVFDIGFPPPSPVLPQELDAIDLGHPCFGGS